MESWLQRWSESVDTDPENRHIGRFSHFRVQLESETGQVIRIQYAAGKLSFVDIADDEGALDLIHLRGNESTWVQLVDAEAPPLRHDLLSLIKAPEGIEVISGWDELLRHLRVITRLVELGKLNVSH
jgi:hypothetical protein